MPSTSSSDKVHDQVKTATKSGKNGNKSLAKKNIAFKTTYDIDDNGLVDGSERPGYKLYTPESGIFITAKSGKTFYEATSEKWSAIAAAPTEKGYRVLITNNQSKKGKYKIWKLSSKGIVRSKGRWLRERALSSKGYEEVFGIDFNGDGMIEADTLIDVGDADFFLTGNATVGKRLRAKRADDDPDGNGRPLITWQAFSGASIWTTADTGKSIRIPATLEGAQVRARVEYKDGDGFQETVFTQSRSIPYVDNGDAAFLIQGTPAVGQTLSITQSVADPDGDGTPSFTWLQSSDGINWSFLSSNPTFDIPDNLEGQTITATVRYTDNQGFEESISTNALSIPYVDNGDAAFLIQGTPAVGQTLSITQSLADPDGDGTPSFTWLQSSDGINWSVISTAPTFNISKDLEGKRIRAIVSYSDGQGFSESINTDDLTIPYVDDGDADFLIQGTAAVSEIISISRSADDPDGNGDGALEIAWQASLDGTNWWEISTASDHQIGSNLAGHQLNAVVQYTDSQGFKETITTDSVSVPGTAGSNSDGKDDYGGSTTTNGRLTINNSISGELELAGDHDWFAINLTAGQRYQFDLNGVSLEDPFLYLRSSSSSLVAYNDDESLLSLDSQLNYTAESSGTHYLDVGAYQDVYAGTYTLRASELTPPDPGFNSTDGYGHVSAQRAFEQLLNISLDPVDALGGNLWGVDNVDAPEVWNGGSGFAGATGSGTTIAVIDTGVDLDHPEFLGRIVAGYDFVDDDSIADDGNGHGTHVAGTIAGANDGTGITGVAYDAAIMPLRVLGNDGYGWTSDIISAVRWAADNGAHVINLSLGVSGYSQAMADAISYASGRGSVVVMAAGNSGGMAPEYPAAHAIDHGIAVGVVDSNRSFAGFSNRAGSTQLDYVTAPGVNIYSAVPGGGYDTFNGTSMATPHVAGVAGLLKSHDGSLSASAIEDLLTGSGSNNSISDSTAWNTTSSIPWSTRDVITMQTLDSFSDKQLSGTLIASVDGNGRERRSTLRGLKQGIRSNDASYDGLEAVKTIEASRNSFAVLEISNDHAINQRALLTELLGSNQFHYLEKEQHFSIV